MNGRSTPILLFVILSACAQIYGDGAERGGPPGGDGGSTTNRRGAGSVTDQQLVLLRATAAELKLTPRQQVLWERYQQKAGALMADQLRPESSPGHRASAPQQIDARVATVRNRLAAIEEVQDAAHALYESLDGEQRKLADQRLAATVPALYSGLISCFTADTARDKPGGAPPRRQGSESR